MSREAYNDMVQFVLDIANRGRGAMIHRLRAMELRDKYNLKDGVPLRGVRRCPMCDGVMYDSDGSYWVGNEPECWCVEPGCKLYRVPIPISLWELIVELKKNAVDLAVAMDCLEWIARPKATGEAAAFARRALKKMGKEVK